MKIKKLIIVLLLLLLSIIAGCSQSPPSNDSSNESNVNLNKLLEYKGSKAGDNSALGNIISNLPGNTYNKGFELQTKSEPHEITINYNQFEDISIKFEDGSVTSCSLPFVMKANAAIILALVDNLDKVNFYIKSPNIEGGTVTTFTRENLENSLGISLSEVVEDRSSLERFIITTY
ncbi:DUF4825 domain-containing protein [Clostridium sp. D53t1_180928_C8]|uniref:DUF4825 domain-containing protein n=1 Tax=Clostridium sp. D53t1_180928_C8 TaxID=2787101 RepID=UPI001A9B75DA|nr:DUF4825 domain-containing protein [Clostridium sp. D53t1_180928_C8]